MQKYKIYSAVMDTAGPWISSIGITLELIRKVEFGALSRPVESESSFEQDS